MIIYYVQRLGYGRCRYRTPPFGHLLHTYPHLPFLDAAIWFNILDRPRVLANLNPFQTLCNKGFLMTMRIAAFVIPTC